jgi:hypothetical protein
MLLYTALGFWLILMVNVLQGLRWWYKRKRTSDISENFIRDIATNHLPHLYHVQTLICGHLGIALTEPPPIQFVELNGRGK